MTSTTLPTANGIGWFQIGVADGRAAEQFYGTVFGWTFDDDEPYRIVTTPSERSIRGGLFTHGGRMPNHAVFFVVVDDVAGACRRIEEAGGKVIVPPTTTADGMEFANVLDPEGNHFGVYTPKPGNQT